MTTEYPIVLAHGVGMKELKYFRAFGNIQKELRACGLSVYTANTDGFGKIETNAHQLKAFIDKVLLETGAEKVNIIAHSKGGLDSRYMIEHLGMADKVASATFLCTPHKGSHVASWLYALPAPLKYIISFFLTVFYKILGDKHPDVLEVCRELCHSPDDILSYHDYKDGVFMQSYSTTLKKGSDDFLLGIPLVITRKYESGASDGLVTEDSSKYGEYRGECIDGSYSHGEIGGFSANRKKSKRVVAFYIDLASDLSERGF